MLIELKRLVGRRTAVGRKIVCLVLGLSAVTMTEGCYRRTIAPEISYDSDQVDQIRTEIEKLDWDE